jgi:hypothetical protein
MLANLQLCAPTTIGSPSSRSVVWLARVLAALSCPLGVAQCSPAAVQMLQAISRVSQHVYAP